MSTEETLESALSKAGINNEYFDKEAKITVTVNLCCLGIFREFKDLLDKYKLKIVEITSDSSDKDGFKEYINSTNSVNHPPTDIIAVKLSGNLPPSFQHDGDEGIRKVNVIEMKTKHFMFIVEDGNAELEKSLTPHLEDFNTFFNKLISNPVITILKQAGLSLNALIYEYTLKHSLKAEIKIGYANRKSEAGRKASARHIWTEIEYINDIYYDPTFYVARIFLAKMNATHKMPIIESRTKKAKYEICYSPRPEIDEKFLSDGFALIRGNQFDSFWNWYMLAIDEAILKKEMPPKKAEVQKFITEMRNHV